MTETFDYGTALQTLYVYFFAGVVAMTRFVSMIIVMPAFSRLGLSGLIQTIVALALAIPVLPAIAQAAASDPVSMSRVSFLILKEAAIGTVIGFVLGIPIWAAEAAGDILDLQRGTTFAGLLDPASSSETSVTGTLLAVVMVALFFATGGMQLILRTMYESYAIWPANSFAPIFSAEAGRIFLSLLDDIMNMGLLLAIPLVLALLLADFALAIVARASPHLHIFDLSLTVKNLMYVILFVFYGAFMVSYMEYDLAWLLSAKDKLQAISGTPR